MKKLEKKARERKTVESYGDCVCGGCTLECNAAGSNYARVDMSAYVGSQVINK